MLAQREYNALATKSQGSRKRWCWAAAGIKTICINPQPKYHFHSQQIADFEGLCRKFEGSALQSPFRSTVPLLSLVHHSRDRWQTILDAINAPHDVEVDFEHRVPSPKPGGKASHTDILLTSKSIVWAIEAKWTEPRYATVKTRLANPEKDGSDPRHTVTGWLKHFQHVAGTKLNIDDFGHVAYQQLHRAASACASAATRQRRPELVYLHFHPSPHTKTQTTEEYIKDLTELRRLLGRPSGLKFNVVEVLLKPTQAFDDIRHLDKRSTSTSNSVREALCRGPLFDFELSGCVAIA
jgi:hypothetical protein